MGRVTTSKFSQIFLILVAVKLFDKTLKCIHIFYDLPAMSNPSYREKGSWLSQIINIMSVHVVMTQQAARTSTVMVFTQFSLNIPVSASWGFISYMYMLNISGKPRYVYEFHNIMEDKTPTIHPPPPPHHTTPHPTPPPPNPYPNLTHTYTHPQIHSLKQPCRLSFLKDNRVITVSIRREVCDNNFSVLFKRKFRGQQHPMMYEQWTQEMLYVDIAFQKGVPDIKYNWL